MAYVPPSDWELKDFIRDHADAVYRSCGFLTVGRGDALTMTREIFRKILNQGMEFRSDREARAWMILTAYQLGKKAPKGGQPEQGEELMKLSRKDRLIALLYYCEGYRKKEIADYLGCTEASVRRRLRRVKRRLDVDGDPEELLKALAPAMEKPFYLAGSVNSFQRIDFLKTLPNLAAFTIGGAFFENKFGEDLTFGEQIDVVVDYMNK